MWMHCLHFAGTLLALASDRHACISLYLTVQMQENLSSSPSFLPNLSQPRSQKEGFPIGPSKRLFRKTLMWPPDGVRLESR